MSRISDRKNRAFAGFSFIAFCAVALFLTCGEETATRGVNQTPYSYDDHHRGKPFWPDDVTATATSATDIKVSWSPVSDARGYLVYSNLDPSPDSVRYIDSVTSTSFEMSYVPPNTTWYFRVASYNSAGEGPWSPMVTLVMPKVNKPSAPAGVTATGISTVSIVINWNAVAGADGYYVWRSDNGNVTENYIWIDSTRSTSYTDTGLTFGKIYYYRIAAYNIAGYGSAGQAGAYTLVAERLNVQIRPAGAGTVAAGITYGTKRLSSKDTTYNNFSSPGISITATAAAKSGYAFTEWSGAPREAVAAGDSITFEMPVGGLTLTANFEPSYTVTVSNGTGGGEYAHGQTVAITAGTAPAGQRFKNWTVTSGGVRFADANSAATTFIMPANAVEVAANFEPVYTVTVTGGTGGGEYAQGERVAVTAETASAGLQFKNWTVTSGGVTLADANSATTTFTMPANAVEVAANFEPAYALTVNRNPTAGGTVSNTPSGTSFVEGTSVTVTAHPSANYKFSGWTGAPEGAVASGNSITFDMPGSAVTLTANFEHIPVYTLTVNRNPVAGGTVSNTPSGTSFVEGTPVNVTASPSGGYRLSGWTGAPEGAVASGNSITFDMPGGAVTLTAQFKPSGLVDDLERCGQSAMNEFGGSWLFFDDSDQCNTSNGTCGSSTIHSATKISGNRWLFDEKSVTSVNPHSGTCAAKMEFTLGASFYINLWGGYTHYPYVGFGTGLAPNNVAIGSKFNTATSVEFWARADRAMKVMFVVPTTSTTANNYAHYEVAINVTTAWQRFQISLTGTGGSGQLAQPSWTMVSERVPLTRSEITDFQWRITGENNAGLTAGALFIDDIIVNGYVNDFAP